MGNIENKQTSINSQYDIDRSSGGVTQILLFVFLGSLFLSTGLRTLIRMTNANTNSQFEDLLVPEWLKSIEQFVSLCIFSFVISFLVILLAKRANAHEQKRRAQFLSIGLFVFFVIINIAPRLYFSFLGLDQSHGSDAWKLREMIISGSIQFMFAGMCFALTEWGRK